MALWTMRSGMTILKATNDGENIVGDDDNRGFNLDGASGGGSH